MATIEICVDSLASTLEADAGGADRLELCSGLSTGGLTPSIGLLRAVRARVRASIHVMIRPRSGDFLYHRVLTSGGAPTALEGRNHLAVLVREANRRIAVMPGGGVRPENILEIARSTGAREFHAALRRPVPSPIQRRAPAVHVSGSSQDEYIRHVVHASDVQALKNAADAHGAQLLAPLVAH